MSPLLQNKKALFDYDVVDTFVAGMVLHGWEVKSLRAGAGNLAGAWVSLQKGEVFLLNLSIVPYKYSNDPQPRERPRKLLLNKKEINKLIRKTAEKGVAIIPLKIFTQKGYLKCEIALAKGRKKHEKRQVLKERSEAKTARTALKNLNG